MKIIEFKFSCSRAVSLYAKLCNYYLGKQDPNIEITINQTQFDYTIEASGTQSQLEQLAEDIAQNFLISTWLINSTVSIIEKRKGTKTPLTHEAVTLNFCQQCHPRFGDNQSPEFGILPLICDHCHGEQKIEALVTLEQLKKLAQQIKRQPIVLNTAEGFITLQQNQPDQYDKGPLTLLVCNPNNLNAHFQLNKQQVLALSSIEKPLIKATPIAEHIELKYPFYYLSFASTRLLVIFSELLRQMGIDWVYLQRHVQPNKSPLMICWIEQGWSEITSSQRYSIQTKIQPLFDHATLAHFDASIEPIINDSLNKQTIIIQPSLTHSDHHDHYKNAALCALHATNIESNQLNSDHSALLYFSSKAKSEILSVIENKVSPFLTLPELPDNGQDVWDLLINSSQKKLFEQFKEQYAYDYNQLIALKLNQRNDSLQSLWAIIALFLNFGRQYPQANVTLLSDCFQAQALLTMSTHAPRIDYPLVKIPHSDTYTFDWCKTIGSVVSFRLAEDNDLSETINQRVSKISYGVIDSFADYLSNWLEQLNQQYDINRIILAGDAFCCEALSRSVSLRLGNNFDLFVNRQLDLDGNNIAFGALYLRQRRF